MNNQNFRLLENINRIKTISQGLGEELLKQVVFVGGSVIGLYATSDSAPDSRPTKDIDCVIKLTSKVNFAKLGEKLRKRGFNEDLSENAPICRWVYKEVVVDIMPDDPSILGFSNYWYKDGIENSVDYNISEKLSIKIFSAPYLIASKIEAFKNRGRNDITVSTDFEDIIYILDNRKELIEEISVASKEIKDYLTETFKELLDNSLIEEGITYCLPYGSNLEKIINIMKKISSL